MIIGLLVLFEAVEGYVDLLKKGQKTLEDMKSEIDLLKLAQTF